MHGIAQGPPPAPTPEEADPDWGPLLQRFVACVCAELTAAGRPACACCLVWDDAIPSADFCDCDCVDGHGQAWVRVRGWQPADSGSRGATRRCQPWRTEVELEAGVYRCVPVVAEDGESAPSCADRSDSAWGFIADTRALRTAASCCHALAGHPVRFDYAGPTPVKGGCAGALVQFTVEL